MAIKTFKVSFILYDNKEQTSKSTGCDIDTTMQGQDIQQVTKMIEAQYNGCAQIRYVIPMS